MTSTTPGRCSVGCSAFCNKVSVIIVVGYGHVVGSLGCTHSVHVVGKCAAIVRKQSAPLPSHCFAAIQRRIAYGVILKTLSVQGNKVSSKASAYVVLQGMLPAWSYLKVTVPKFISS